MADNADERRPLLRGTGAVRDEQGSDTYQSLHLSQASAVGGASEGQLEEKKDNSPKTCCQARAWSSLQRIEKEFLVIALLTGLAMVAFTSHRIHVLKTTQKPLSSGIVMVISEVFSLFYNSHGVFYKRYYEIIIYIIAIYGDIIYCTVDFTALASPTNFEKVRLGIDWSLGCVLPSVLAYYVITRVYCTDGIHPSVRRLDLFKSLLVLDLQLAVCNVVFIVTDRQVDTDEIAMLVIGEIFNLVFFCIGTFAVREKTRDVWDYLFKIIGLIPLVYLVYKAYKQKEGIANGVYLEVASLVFSLLSIITRCVVLALNYRMSRRPSSDNERQHVRALLEDAARDGDPESLAGSRSGEHNMDGGSSTIRKEVHS